MQNRSNGAAAAVNNRRNVAAGTVGNMLEWYDFAVYGFLAPTIGPLFFPSEDRVASLLSAFAVFALGYVARPIGGILFGHVGDRFGRKTAMMASIGLMGTATLAIGLLPTHQMVGTLAAVMLSVLRVVQGIAVGGEYGGSMVFIGENAPRKHRGAVTALAQCGALSGTLLGSAMVALTSGVLGDAAMTAWGWRLPFLIGAAVAVLGLLLRLRLVERKVTFHRLDLPVLAVVRDHWRALARMIALMMMGGVGYQLLFFYVAAELREEMHFSTARALEINTIGLVAMLAMTIPLAALSDRIGRKPLLAFVAVSAVVFSWPLWQLLHRDAFFAVLAGQISLSILPAVTFAVAPATIVEMVPAAVRCSGVSIGYNVCIGIFGGTAPFIATYLASRTGDLSAPAYYIMGLGVLMFAALYRMPETAGKPLDPEPEDEKSS